jgi:murein L,D-transpeptidase YcbB/YkuD
MRKFKVLLQKENIILKKGMVSPPTVPKATKEEEAQKCLKTSPKSTQPVSKTAAQKHRSASAPELSHSRSTSKIHVLIDDLVTHLGVLTKTYQDQATVICDLQSQIGPQSEENKALRASLVRTPKEQRPEPPVIEAKTPVLMPGKAEEAKEAFLKILPILERKIARIQKNLGEKIRQYVAVTDPGYTKALNAHHDQLIRELTPHRNRARQQDLEAVLVNSGIARQGEITNDMLPSNPSRSNP